MPATYWIGLAAAVLLIAAELWWLMSRRNRP
jgi:hypothetical protein